jgi:NADH-quinone oxidoreductase subunit C
MNTNASELLTLVQGKLGGQILSSNTNLNDVTLLIRRDQSLDCFRILKLDVDLQFNFLVDITATDFLDSRPTRFEVVYHLLSLSKGYRLRIKIEVPEPTPEVDSLTSLWHSAIFMERETWDMYGIKFRGHPDLRRILMYPEFEGHPLRKDYPVQAKQPRVPLRAPEVTNTARDMKRPPLFSINKRNTAQENYAK